MRLVGVIISLIFWAAAACFADPNDVLKVENPSPANPSQETSLPTENPEKSIELQVCRDSRLGIRLLCNPDWGLQTEKETMLIIVSSDPAVTITIAQSKSPVIFPEQLTRDALSEMGQYAEGFIVENVTFAKERAICVEGFSREYPEIRLLDYYVVHDFKLYSVLFSVNPKERWPDYRPLIDKIIDSFEFVTPPEDVFNLEELKRGELKPMIVDKGEPMNPTGNLPKPNSK